MGPPDIINGGFRKVRKSTFAVDQVLISNTKISVKSVTHLIIVFQPKSITSVGIIIPQNSQVEIITYGEIVTSILQEITTIITKLV